MYIANGAVVDSSRKVGGHWIDEVLVHFMQSVYHSEKKVCPVLGSRPERKSLAILGGNSVSVLGGLVLKTV